MPRQRPQDPEALAALIAVLKAYAEGRTDTEVGRSATERLGSAGVDRDLAQRMVARFERIRPSIRQRALGDFADVSTVRLRPRSIDEGQLPIRADREPFERLDTQGAGSGTSTASNTGTGTATSRGREVREASRINENVNERADEHQPASYQIHYEGMYCREETGWDRFSWSDEIYAVTSAVWISADGQQNPDRTEKHPTDAEAYGDVDAGEVRRGPVASCWAGSLFPVSLTVVAWEHDEGDPNAYRDEVAAIVKAALTVASILYPGATAVLVLEAASGIITDGINWILDTGDDQIGIAHTEVFEQSTLEELGKRPAAPYPGTQEKLWGHFFSTHKGSGAEYVFAFKLERTPPFVEEIIII